MEVALDLSRRRPGGKVALAARRNDRDDDVDLFPDRFPMDSGRPRKAAPERFPPGCHQAGSLFRHGARRQLLHAVTSS